MNSAASFTSNMHGSRWIEVVWISWLFLIELCVSSSGIPASTQISAVSLMAIVISFPFGIYASMHMVVSQ